MGSFGTFQITQDCHYCFSDIFDPACNSNDAAGFLNSKNTCFFSLLNVIKSLILHWLSREDEDLILNFLGFVVFGLMITNPWPIESLIALSFYHQPRQYTK